MLGLKDLIVTPVYIFLLYTLAFWIKSRFFKNDQRGTFLIHGLSIKIIGALAFCLVYSFIYDGGDTSAYYKGSTVMFESAREGWHVPFEILFSHAHNHSFEYASYTSQIYANAETTFMVIRFAFVFGLITFNTFTATAILFSVFSLSGLWALFSTFRQYFPTYEKVIFYSILLVPSMVFWGSGIMKDTLILGFVGWLVYALNNIFQRKKVIVNFILLAVAAFMIVRIKAYVFLAIIPSLGVWSLFNFIRGIGDKKLRLVAIPIVFALVIGATLVASSQIVKMSQKFAIENISQTIGSIQWYHSYLSEKNDGSGYTLGEFEPNLLNFLLKAPKAINVTLFRPYLWEARKPIMVFSAIEAFLFLIFTLFVVLRSGALNVIRIIYNSNVLLMSFIFALVLSLAVGLTSYNFGALVRYKIPVLPFYVVPLIIAYLEVNRAKKRGVTASLE